MVQIPTSCAYFYYIGFELAVQAIQPLILYTRSCENVKLEFLSRVYMVNQSHQSKKKVQIPILLVLNIVTNVTYSNLQHGYIENF